MDGASVPFALVADSGSRRCTVGVAALGAHGGYLGRDVRRGQQEAQPVAVGETVEAIAPVDIVAVVRVHKDGPGVDARWRRRARLGAVEPAPALERFVEESM